MSTPIQPRWRAAMNARLFNDIQRQNALSGMEKVAPLSPLMAVPAVAASYNALVTKGTTLVTAVAAVPANEKIYKSSLSATATARRAFDLEIDNLKTLVENSATSAGDVTSMGFPLLVPASTTLTAPEPPAVLIVRIGKAHGKARVAVEGKGYLGTFVAEVSTDPIGPSTWTPLPGTGKQRKLTGYATGTKLWVHFALVRSGQQSAWSVPVLVTIP
jgi:hypothetical protein